MNPMTTKILRPRLTKAAIQNIRAVIGEASGSAAALDDDDPAGKRISDGIDWLNRFLEAVESKKEQQ